MLLNRLAVRRYILKAWAEQRPTHEITRVDPSVYIALDSLVKEKIRKVIDRHPSRGKTFYVD